MGGQGEGSIRYCQRAQPVLAHPEEISFRFRQWHLNRAAGFRQQVPLFHFEQASPSALVFHLRSAQVKPGAIHASQNPAWLISTGGRGKRHLGHQPEAVRHMLLCRGRNVRQHAAGKQEYPSYWSFHHRKFGFCKRAHSEQGKCRSAPCKIIDIVVSPLIGGRSEAGCCRQSRW